MPRLLPSRRRTRTVTPGRVALAGALLGAGGGLLRLLRSRGDGGDGGSSVPTGPTPPPAPANYDAPGPPGNSATPVAAPPINGVDLSPVVDEDAEVEAAAAEAAAIGGRSPEYASSEASLLADEAERPLVESGEGEAEGQDQTEAELLENVTAPYGPGAGVSDAERQIEQAIADQENPAVGETPDPAAPPEGHDRR